MKVKEKKSRRMIIIKTMSDVKLNKKGTASNRA